MALYRAGTISLTQGSAMATGTGTLFKGAVSEGDMLLVAQKYYEVIKIVDDTTLTLDVAALATVSGSEYVILKSLHTASNLYLMRKIEEYLVDRTRSLAEMVAWIGGTATGGPNGDGRYPLTDRFGSTKLVKCPEALASQTAEGQATIATEQAAIATASAALAQQWASNPLEAAITAGKYSSFHWAQKAANVVRAADNLSHLVVQIPITAATIRVDLPTDRYTTNEPIVIVTIIGGPTEVSLAYPKELVVGVGEVHTHVRLTFPVSAIGKKANVWVTGQ